MPTGLMLRGESLACLSSASEGTGVQAMSHAGTASHRNVLHLLLSKTKDGACLAGPFRWGQTRSCCVGRCFATPPGSLVRGTPPRKAVLGFGQRLTAWLGIVVSLELLEGVGDRVLVGLALSPGSW